MGGVLGWVTGVIELEVASGPCEGSGAVEGLEVIREASTLYFYDLVRAYEAGHLVLMIFG